MAILDRFPRYVIAIALFLSIVSTTEAKYSGGTGEPNDPYQIATAEDLIALGETPDDYDKHFILTADIDLDPNLPGGKIFDKAVIASLMPGEHSWLLVGTSFTGVFDGNGHTISHMTIKGGGYLGLFGYLRAWPGPGEIRNLGLVDVNIAGLGKSVGGLVGSNSGNLKHCHSSGLVSGTDEVGGLVGDNDYGTIVSSRSSSMVSGSGDWSVGGLVGRNDGTVTYCDCTGVVTGNRRVGGLVGFNNGGTIAMSSSVGPVDGNDMVGGLVGENWGEVSGSFAGGSVSGVSRIGGVVGANYDEVGVDGFISRCCSAGLVTGRTHVGGLVGENGTYVSDCYSTGAVTGGDNVGGLIGTNDCYILFQAAWWGSVSRCYATGIVVGNANVGGLVGQNVCEGVFAGESGAEVVDSFWDTQASGRNWSNGGIGKTSVEMQTAKTFVDAGWDFVDETENGTEDIWKIAEGLGYPRLAWEKYSGGTGEPNDPYQIATAADLILLGETPEDYDKHFILTADIDLDPNLPGRKVFDKAVIAQDIDPTLYEYGYNPFDGPAFTGFFDGDGHAISHLMIEGDSYLGLFGQVEYGAVIYDLSLEAVNISGIYDYVGGLVGWNYGSVFMSYVSGSVSGNDDVGGLVGYQGSESITSSYSSSSVSGDSHVGGLVGDNSGRIANSYSSGSVEGIGEAIGGLAGYNGEGVLTECHSTASVGGGWWVGGLVGCNWISTVTRCYSTGSVRGNSDVGGLIGFNSNYFLWSVLMNYTVNSSYSLGIVTGVNGVGGLVGANAGNVSHCYSTGIVMGTGEDVGGLIGAGSTPGWEQSNDGIVTKCMWDIQTSGQTVSNGGTGKTTDEMQTACTFLEAGWDFVGETANGTEDIWWILEGQDYPRLWWETE